MSCVSLPTVVRSFVRPFRYILSAVGRCFFGAGRFSLDSIQPCHSCKHVEGEGKGWVGGVGGVGGLCEVFYLMVSRNVFNSRRPELCCTMCIVYVHTYVDVLFRICRVYLSYTCFYPFGPSCFFLSWSVVSRLILSYPVLYFGVCPCRSIARTHARAQSSLKKSEWDTKPEGYRDPANAAKMAAPRQQVVTQAIEAAV